MYLGHGYFFQQGKQNDKDSCNVKMSKWVKKQSLIWKCFVIKKNLVALLLVECLSKEFCVQCLVASPGPNGCRNQVLPRPAGLVEGWVGWTARLVFTSPLLSSTVGITTTGISVHCSRVLLEDMTSVYPSSQRHAFICRRTGRFIFHMRCNLGNHN